MWYFYALLGPAIWALLNHLDKYLLGRFFKVDAAGPVLAVFTGFAGIMVAVTISLFGPAMVTLSAEQACGVMAAGALLVTSYVPYLIAMQRDEASTVASLYRLSPLFVFILSYFVLGESIQSKQILGGLTTIAGSIYLIIDLGQPGHRFRLATLLLMGGACAMNACTVVIFKLVALHASFWSSAFCEYIGAGMASLALICGIPSYRHALLSVMRSRAAFVLVPITLSGEAFNLLANLAVGFAGLMAPLALVSIVTGLHPLFALMYGILFTLLLPAFAKERVALRHLLPKVGAIGVICAGMAITFAE
jgi:uncharacterized membrane protein